MEQIGRRKKHRNVDADHSRICFKPCGIKRRSLEVARLSEDEMEAIRLSDQLGLYQQECAERMGISRPTFSRTIEGARRKIADALLNGKAIMIASHPSNNAAAD
jgi:predicted DNA-binding protein (UPF0251 family)